MKERKKQRKKGSKRKKAPSGPAGDLTRGLPITSPAFYHWAVSPLPWGGKHKDGKMNLFASQCPHDHSWPPSRSSCCGLIQRRTVTPLCQCTKTEVNEVRLDSFPCRFLISITAWFVVFSLAVACECCWCCPVRCAEYCWHFLVLFYEYPFKLKYLLALFMDSF